MQVLKRMSACQPGVQGSVMIVSFCCVSLGGRGASSAFFSSYSYISMFLTVVSGSTAEVMSVFGDVHVWFMCTELLVCTASLNT